MQCTLLRHPSLVSNHGPSSWCPSCNTARQRELSENPIAPLSRTSGSNRERVGARKLIQPRRAGCFRFAVAGAYAGYGIIPGRCVVSAAHAGQGGLSQRDARNNCEVSQHRAAEVTACSGRREQPSGGAVLACVRGRYRQPDALVAPWKPCDYAGSTRNVTGPSLEQCRSAEAAPE